MDPQTREQLDNWIVAEILKNKAAWLHAFYSTMLPPHIYNKAAKDNDMAEVTKYCKEQDFAIREFASPYGGETHIEKAGVLVATFKPKLVDGPDDHKVMTFEAYVLGKQVPTVRLTEKLN